MRLHPRSPRTKRDVVHVGIVLVGVVAVVAKPMVGRQNDRRVVPQDVIRGNHVEHLAQSVARQGHSLGILGAGGTVVPMPVQIGIDNVQIRVGELLVAHLVDESSDDRLGLFVFVVGRYGERSVKQVEFGLGREYGRAAVGEAGGTGGGDKVEYRGEGPLVVGVGGVHQCRIAPVILVFGVSVVGNV